MITIREAVLKDAHQIAKIHVITWQDAYKGIISQEVLDGLSIEKREKMWQQSLSRTNSSEKLYVAENEKGDAVGFAGGGPVRSGEEKYSAELFVIYVLPEYQREGIGKRLFKEVLINCQAQGLNSLLLWALQESPYKKFYQSLGGEKVSKKPYQIGEKTHLSIGYGWNNIQSILDQLK